MPSRHDEQQPKSSSKKRKSWSLRKSSIGAADTPEGCISSSTTSTRSDAPPGTLSPISSQMMNSLKLVNSPSRELQAAVQPIDVASKYKAHPDNLDGSADSKERSEGLPRVRSNGRLNGIPSSSHPTHDQASTAKSYTNSTLSPISSVQSVRTISSEFDRPQVNFPIAEDANANQENSSQWSSAVGKASLGKTGRVLEKLIGENDMLKRELNLEKLKSEDNRSAVKMVEARMDAQTNEYESRLHEAAVNKTLLRRRERQVIELKEQIELEKARAESAVEKERTWRQAMEDTKIESEAKIAEAVNKTMLYEGRYNALESHWKDKQSEHTVRVAEHAAVIKGHLDDRIRQAREMQVLHDLCEQLKHSHEGLEAENKRIKNFHEDYKETQEALLAGIKGKTAHQEKTYEALLEDANKTIGEMRWVMNVHRDLRPDSSVKGAK